MNDQANTPDAPPPGGPTSDETKPIAAQPSADYPPPTAETRPAAGSTAAPGAAATPDPTVAPPPPGGTSTLTDDAQPPRPPAEPVAAARPDRPGAVAAMTAVGVALLATAIVISASRSRADGDLDWSNYVVGLGATAALILIAVAAAGAVRRRDNPLGRAELVTWPGVVGILGVAAMFTVGLEGQDWLDDVFGYVVGGIIAGLAIIGYLAARRAAFVVLAIYGLGIIYADAFSDLFGDVGDGDDFAIVSGIALSVFVVAVTIVGWLLPTRAVSGVAVGVAGLVGLVGLMAAVMFAELFVGAFAMFGMGGEPTDPLSGPQDQGDLGFANDAWVLIGLAAVHVVMWSLAAARTGHSGFTILAIILPAAVVPMGMAVLAVEHPTWWGVTVAAVGAVLLVGGGLLGRNRARFARETP